MDHALLTSKLTMSNAAQRVKLNTWGSVLQARGPFGIMNLGFTMDRTLLLNMSLLLRTSFLPPTGPTSLLAGSELVEPWRGKWKIKKYSWKLGLQELWNAEA